MVEIGTRDRMLIAAVQDGLPLVQRPYAAVGERIDMPETEVIERIRVLCAQGVIKRLGVIVRHRELGYRANAMVVWDVPDDRVNDLGRRFGGFEYVTLCYRRPRRLPYWPYNLFTMIHGRDRDAVREHIDQLVEACEAGDLSHEVLFSGKRFKQRGARYLEAAR